MVAVVTESLLLSSDSCTSRMVVSLRCIGEYFPMLLSRIQSVALEKCPWLWRYGEGRPLGAAGMCLDSFAYTRSLFWNFATL